MTNEFFTSDQHFYHTNIIRHCNRPFSNVEEMNESLITRWNSKVGRNDKVRVLGDLFFGHIGGKDAIESILSRLNGKITLVLGNHDKKWLKWYTRPPFPVFQYLMENFNGTNIFMCHYTMVNWDRSHYGTWHLYGHSHEDRVAYKPPNSLNVAVDLHNFYPLEFEEIRAKLNAIKKPESIVL